MRVDITLGVSNLCRSHSGLDWHLNGDQTATGGNAMNDPVPSRPLAENDVLTGGSSAPLVFISHDTRDADLAEAFSKLLKSVSAGMIKTFRSSD